MTSPVIRIPDLPGLLDENGALAAAFGAWHEQFPDSDAYFSPLNPIWRYPAAATHQPEDLVALNVWIRRLYAYLGMVEMYYVDVLERRDKLQRFHLMDLGHCAGGFAWSHLLKGEDCLAVLAAHRQLLLIEQKKQDDAWHGAFRQLLNEAMSKPGHGIKGAASEMQIDRGTLGDYLGGTKDTLQIETKIKMRNYILKYCPHAKQQIQQLGL